MGEFIGGGVMAPAGDDPTRPNRTPKRVRPDQFLRELDALPTPPPMDVVSHHPYPIRPPERKGGRNFIDLYNFERLVTTIDATYLKGKPIWLTEYGFGTAPVENYKLFFPPQRQAELIADGVAHGLFQLIAVGTPSNGVDSPAAILRSASSAAASASSSRISL